MARVRSRCLIGGYTWNRCMARARQANDHTRDVLADIHAHLTATPPAGLNVLLLSQLLTDAALAVAANAAALTELRAIADAQLSALAGGTDHLPAGPARPHDTGEASPGDASPHNNGRRKQQ